jgi:hypothetical protein
MAMKKVDIGQLVMDMDGKSFKEDDGPDSPNLTVKHVLKTALARTFSTEEDEIFELINLGLRISTMKLQENEFESGEVKKMQKAVREDRGFSNIIKHRVLSLLKAERKKK